MRSGLFDSAAESDIEVLLHTTGINARSGQRCQGHDCNCGIDLLDRLRRILPFQ